MRWPSGRIGLAALLAAGVALLLAACSADEPTAASPSPPAAVYSNKPVTVALAELACESGTAVANPSANSALVNDCARLLALRDTLAGTGALNWTAGMAMTSWTGVTVGGSPRRVTRLQLASNGLTGQVSGLVGELAGLTELWLNGNRLTGRLPSKLGRLTKLTHAYIAGNAFTGCAPPLLRTVANNDVAQLGLADCAEPTDMTYYRGPLSPGTYRFHLRKRDPPLVFDIPEGGRFIFGGVVFQAPARGILTRAYGPVGLVINDASLSSWVVLDVTLGGEWVRTVVEPAPSRAPGSLSASDAGPGIGALFDLIVESMWPGTP